MGNFVAEVYTRAPQSPLVITSRPKLTSSHSDVNLTLRYEEALNFIIAVSMLTLAALEIANMLAYSFYLYSSDR